MVLVRKVDCFEKWLEPTLPPIERLSQSPALINQVVLRDDQACDIELCASRLDCQSLMLVHKSSHLRSDWHRFYLRPSDCRTTRLFRTWPFWWLIEYRSKSYVHHARVINRRRWCRSLNVRRMAGIHSTPPARLSRNASHVG